MFLQLFSMTFICNKRGKKSEIFLIHWFRTTFFNHFFLIDFRVFHFYTNTFYSLKNWAHILLKTQSDYYLNQECLKISLQLRFSKNNIFHNVTEMKSSEISILVSLLSLQSKHLYIFKTLIYKVNIYSFQKFHACEWKIEFFKLYGDWKYVKIEVSRRNLQL